jgi:hypothetical protein
MTAAWIGLLLAAGAVAPAWAAQSAGVPTEWDIRKNLDAIVAYTTRLQSVLDQIDPKTWVSKGAPEQYVSQWNSSRTQAKALATSAQILGRNPEKLTGTLETYFRLQSLESSLNSLGEGIRKYQNPALADLLGGIVAENGANRERLQQYVMDLAGERENEYRVVDQEAQRCREFLSKRPQTGRAERKADKH